MRHIVTSLCLICVLAVGAAQAQEQRREEKYLYVAVPREVVPSLIASQPDSPLQIEKVEFLMGIDGGTAHNYRLRNRGTKPIRSFTVAHILGNGLGGSFTWDLKPRDWIAPGQLVPPSAHESASEIVPLTDELREKLKLRGPLKIFIIYMVERVEFADGSVYSDEAIAAALRSYLYALPDRPEN